MQASGTRQVPEGKAIPVSDDEVLIVGDVNGVLIASGPGGPEGKPFATMDAQCDYVGRHRRRSDPQADAESHQGVCSGGAS
jgi:hypothetical protein